MSGAAEKSGGPMLAVKDLSVIFGTGQAESHAVRGVSFEIAKGETLALVGESGSGKSVSALSILRLLDYPHARHDSGSVIYDGDDLLKVPDRRLRQIRGRKISMIFQEPMTSLNPLHNVERQLTETLSLHQGMRQKAARARALELLEQVGIRDAETRLTSFPHELSGGQRQRVMIAMALANNPDLLIADEPTTALDVTVQAQILTLLKDLQRSMGMAILFITHDFGIVRRMADKICVMQNGEIVERGSVNEVFSNPQHAYTRALLDAEPKGDPTPVDPLAPVIAEARDLKVWFPIKQGVLRRTVGHIKAVDGVTVNLKQGQTLGVVGESGSGKSTLGQALLRLLPSEGRIVVLGEEVSAFQPAKLRSMRSDMQIVFQDPFGSLSPRMTVGEIISEGLGVHFPKLSGTEKEQKVIDTLIEVGLDPETRHRYPHEFSGGQRQRISIARAIVLEPRLLVLDEPTSALDMSVQAQIVDLLRALQQKHGLTYLFISHDLKVVRSLANELIIMQEGKVVEQGSAVDIFAQPQSEYTKALISAAFDERAIGAPE